MQNYKNKNIYLDENTDTSGGDSVADGGNSVADPLSTPAGDFDISRPVAMAANYEMKIKEAKLEPKRDDASRINIMITLENTKEVRSTKGSVIEPGHLVLRKYYPTQPSEKQKATEVGAALARLIRGVGLPAQLSPRDLINQPSTLTGKVGIWKVKIKKETAEYPEGNEVGDPIIEG